MGVQTLGQVSASVELPPGFTAKKVEVWIDIDTEEQLEQAVEMCGGVERMASHVVPTSRLVAFDAFSPAGGRLTVNLWLGDELVPHEVTVPPVERLLRRRDEARTAMSRPRPRDRIVEGH